MPTPWPWPNAIPDLPFSGHGWMNDENKRVLASFLNAETKTIVEIGTWLGLSARFMLDRAPNARLYAVDHWDGLPLVEWKGFGLPEAEWKKLAPDPWAQFVRDSWEYRGRLVPIRMDSWRGIETLSKIKGVNPDLVYIDGGHGYERVLGDITRVRGAWPDAVVVGDDWTWPGVKQAVEEFVDADESIGLCKAGSARSAGPRNVVIDGNCWWFVP